MYACFELTKGFFFSDKLVLDGGIIAFLYTNIMNSLYNIFGFLTQIVELSPVCKFITNGVFSLVMKLVHNILNLIGKYPTKHLCILVPAPFWYLISIIFLHWC